MLTNPILSNLITKNLKVKIEPLINQKQLQDEALKILCRIFATQEPLTLEVRASERDIQTAMQNTFEASLKHSSIAYTPHNNKILGISISGDVSSLQQLADNSSPPPTSMQSIFGLLDICSDKFYKKKQINKNQLKSNQLLSQMMIAVQPDAAGMNLGVNLLLHNLQLAKINNFEMAKIECTSKRSAAISQKLDYDLIEEINYESVSIDPSNILYWKDVPKKYNEDKLFILSKNINSFDQSNYNFDKQNIFQFLFK